MTSSSKKNRPFYEFGVWRATSFKYLLKIFKKGYGFDTFTGLPEDWDVGNGIEKAGTYSSDGNVPKLKAENSSRVNFKIPYLSSFLKVVL